MNYPKVMTNPLLKKRETQKELKDQKDKMIFSNMKRPISGYQYEFARPFSTKAGGETLMH